VELAMITIKTSDILQSEAKTGKTKYWLIRALKDGDKYYLQKEYWQGDGKHQKSEPYIMEPKNVGKSNATTPKEQVLLELERQFKKHMESGYHREGEEYEGYPLPMLALKWKNRKHNIVYPCAIQAKWDGIRCLKFKDEYWTRKGKVIIPALVQHCNFDASHWILDGELVIPGENMQTISSFTKKVQKNQERLEYHVFDILNVNLTFSERFERLTELSKRFPKGVKLSETYIAENEEQVAEYHSQFTEFFEIDGKIRNQQGYFEGTIIRNLDGKYLINHRSSDLLKLKDFVDEECEIIGFAQGKGRNAGSIKFVCKYSNDEEFEVNPCGTMVSRREMWNNREKLIGKMLTVEFQELTERGVPRFPVGKCIRDYE
jgi:DNA ligase 1